MAKYIFMISLFLLNGCSLFQLMPHTCEAIQDETWERVIFENYNISVELPVDKDFAWVQWKSGEHIVREQQIRQELFRIVPNSIWEPVTVAIMDIRMVKNNNQITCDYLTTDIILNYLKENGEGKGIAYKYYRPDWDEISYEYNSYLNKAWSIQIRIDIKRVKSIGVAYYRHDPTYPQRLEKIYKRILWSFEYEGNRIFHENSPEVIKINTIETDEIPEDYEKLFGAFGF